MQASTRLLFGTALAACALVGVALATPKHGLNFFNVLASGTINSEVLDHVHVALPAAGPEREDGWAAKVVTTGPSNFLVQDVSYLPGGATGWHSHPGILLSTVTEGSIEWYDVNCQKHVYNVGDSLTETTAVHYVRNAGTVNARFLVTYIIAKDQPWRIDQPAPACAAPLGLN